MATGSRFQSPQAQRRAVTVVMTAVFAGTLALAMMTAAMREPAEPAEVRHLGLRLEVPGHWVEDAPRAAALELAQPLVLRDPERANRWLLVTRSAPAEPIEPGEVMSRFLSALLDPVQERTLESIAAQGPQPHAGLRMVQYIGHSRPPNGAAGAQLHLAMTLTDGRQHWLIYLTDHVAPGESTRLVLRQNMALLGSVERSVHREDR